MSDYYRATYIWLDGTEPTPQLRSKTKILQHAQKIPVWGFDGSSTNQAPGEASDCVLRPVFTCPDTSGRFRNPKEDILVLCEVYNTDGTVHKSNTRNQCDAAFRVYQEKYPIFGFEQEYTFMKGGTPHGFAKARTKKLPVGWPTLGDTAIMEQGPYYCSVGSGLAVGRHIAEEHLDACLRAGLRVSGMNAEVMPGQWEFQVGPLDPVMASDQLWVARWLLDRIAESYEIEVSLEGKPATGDWNGAGCHTNFSTENMRNSMEACVNACIALGENRNEHVKNYGAGIENRLTGDHETCSYKEFKYGVSDRGASVRIPWQVEQDDGGYIEDRRPNANCDPYTVSALVTTTICAAEN
jgi:glutamine synthetase